jgi:Tfp pilus assembly protein PilF
LSLLLDALRRAEQEKHARHPGGPPPAEAHGHRSASPSALELAPISTHAAAAGHRADPAAHGAQNVFQAKAANSPGATPRNRTVLWVAIGAIGLVAIAAGAYVWYSVKSLTPQYAATPRPRAVPPPPPASGTIAPSVTASSGFVPIAPGSVATLTPTTPEPPPAPAPAPAQAAPAPPPPPPATTAERILREAPPVAPPPGVQLDRTPAPARSVPAGVAAGYEALRLGDLAAARRGYDAAIAADPANVDARLGIATIAAREGNRALAFEHYRRALDLDPRNPTALAGIALLADASRPEALEMQLRTEIARAPESAELVFALGNVYATQSRWTEAQAAYYEAHRLDPGSADIAHNLAVSLDRLGQGRLAAGFYRRALESASGRAAQFDAAAVARRLEELR